MAGSNCANHPEDEAALPAGLSRSGEGARRPLQLSDAAKRCVNTRPDVLLEPAVLLARAGLVVTETRLSFASGATQHVGLQGVQPRVIPTLDD